MLALVWPHLPILPTFRDPKELLPSTHSCFNRVLTLCNPMDLAHQVPLFIGISRQEYWSGLPCPLPGDLRDPGIEAPSLEPSVLAGRFFTSTAIWEAQLTSRVGQNI